MEINRSLDPNPKFTRALSIPIHRIRGIRTRKGTAAAPRLPLALGLERNDVPGDDGAVFRRVSVGDSFNDEQRSNNLSSQWSCQTTGPEIAAIGKHKPESQRGWARRDPQSSFQKGKSR